ncbi:MAG: MIP/aquaporin family protein [Bacteroidota bacterium]
MTPFVAELLGTMILLLLGNGVVANVLLKSSKGHGPDWLLISAGWGMAVFAGVMVSAEASGAHLNPAVSIATAIASADFSWGEAAQYILAQLIGASLGTSLVWLAYRLQYEVTEDRDAKLGTFCTAPEIRGTVSNLLTEAIGTFVLVFVALSMASPELTADGLTNGKMGLGAIGALPVGLLVFGIGMSLGGPTGYAINPARDLMPRIMHSILPISDKRDGDWSYSWIPVAGPIAGGVIAALLYIGIHPV